MSKSSRIPTTSQDRMHFINRMNCNQQINSIIHLDGRVDEGRFARAVRLAVDAEPILGCRFVVRPWRPYWERHPNLDRLEFFDSRETAEVERDTRDFLGLPIDPCRDPLVRLRLLRHGDNDTLCAKICHVVGDLGGLREFVYAVGEIYGRLGDDPGYVPPPRAPGDRGMWPVFRSMGVRRRLKMLRRGRKDFIKPERWRLPLDGASGREPAYTFKRIRKDDFAAIVAAARAHRATLNEVVLTAYFRALCRWTSVPDGEDMPLVNTMDLRHYLPGRRAGSICNLSAPLVPVFKAVADEPFWATLARVAAEMRQQKRSSPGLMPALLMGVMFQAPFFLLERLFGKLFETGRRKGTSIPTFTDGGDVRFELAGTSIRNIIGVGPVAYPPNFFFSSGTCRDSMTWVVAHCKSDSTTSSIEQLLEDMASDLLDAALAPDLAAVGTAPRPACPIPAPGDQP